MTELEVYRKFREDVQNAKCWDDERGMSYLDDEIDKALDILRKRLAILRGE